MVLVPFLALGQGQPALHSGPPPPARAEPVGADGGAQTTSSGGATPLENRVQPASGVAEDPKLLEARARFEVALAAYEKGRFADALEGFEAAYAKSALPAFLFNIAQCQRKLNRTGEALASYQKYLAVSPEPPPNAVLTRELIADMETRLAWQEHVEGELRRSIEREVRLKAERAYRVKLARALEQSPPPEAPLHRRWYFWAGFGVLLVASGATVMAAQNTAPGAPLTLLPPSR